MILRIGFFVLLISVSFGLLLSPIAIYHEYLFSGWRILDVIGLQIILLIFGLAIAVKASQFIDEVYQF